MNQQRAVLDQLGAVFEGTQKLEGMMNQITDNIGTAFLELLTSKIDPSERKDVKRNWQQEFISTIYQNAEDSATHEAPTLEVPEYRRARLQKELIKPLRFSGMEDREERIAKAHEKTFQWIFEDDGLPEKRWANFKEWLETDSRLYWITGKAGSGKSTLLKYICSGVDPTDLLTCSDERERSCVQISRCTKHLQKWAAGSMLIVATFFFWNSGYQLQMSQNGLLRSLLHQILRQNPDLVPFVSPSRWEALCLFGEDPRETTDQELRQMLRSAAQSTTKEMKLCLFVDGLDEFSGDLDDLISLFKDLITYPHVKVCVSSRPLVVFEDAFKQQPSLMLQDLTYADIKHYTTATLHEDHGFAQLRRRETVYADQLVENIVSKASGVFLWIHLVVESLRAGMAYGDRVIDLQRRLDLLPPDLEALYQKVLLSLDPFYLEHAAQLFKLVQGSLDPPPVLLLSFADEESLESALNRPVQNIRPDEISLREDTMRRRLNSRCKGLLEVGYAPIGTGKGTVQYLHRTVKDYIESDEPQSRLESALKSSFDPHLQLCLGSLVYLKTFEGINAFRINSPFWPCVQSLLYSSSRLQSIHYSSIVPLLDELDRTGSSLAKQYASLPAEEQTLRWPRLILSRLEAGYWVLSHPLADLYPTLVEIGSTIISLAVRYGVVEYVEAKAQRGCLVQHADNIDWSLLWDATHVDSC